MNITHAKIVTLPVVDQDRAKAFYVDLLGFEVLMDQEMGPMRWLQVAPKGAQTSFTLATSAMGAFTPGHAQGIVLETADVDAACASLREAGVEVEGPADYPWARQATFKDPDGNGLVLSTSAAANS
ncbi:VOC family protein [Streptomyces pathocidini]|uniref:VOC family protein n=1 Tax=Streptomyces pathocidini TaxID=1650571 RepID=A0ABW7UPH1_9ACTN|nr:VOC family protein [Streptomyces pathocidini]